MNLPLTSCEVKDSVFTEFLLPREPSARVAFAFLNASVYVYEESGAYRDTEGGLVPSYTGICGDAVSVNVPAQSLTVITDMQ